MASNPPSMLLKVVWLLHFVLSSWAMLSGFLAVSTYLYTHLAVLGIGLWAIIDSTSTDAVIMFVATLMISIVNDVILLGIYEPRGHDYFEDDDNNVSTGKRNEYRFALGMCITNLLLKPISMFLLYRIYQSRADGTEFNSGIPGMGGSGGSRGGYDDLGPNNTSTKEPPLYSEPGYQQPPPSSLH